MVFLLILLILILLFISSKVRIEISNFEFVSNRNRHINKNYKCTFKFCILGKIPIIKINITKNKLEKIKINDRIKKIDFNKIIESNIKTEKRIIEGLKELQIDVKKFDLRVNIGTENAALTSMLIPIISTVIAIFISKKIKDNKNQLFIINPIYMNQNILNILFSSIFEIKMIHIINIVYILNKKEGVNKNERASDRRAYDYSYE